MTKLGQDLIQSAGEALAIAEGAAPPARIVEPQLGKNDEVDVAALRKGLGLSQADFAARFGFSVATVRDWEQQRRRPDRMARTLLRVIERHPDVVAAAVAA